MSLEEAIAALETFSDSEKRVVLSVIEGLHRGRSVYSTLDLSTDERDFRLESLEELRDAVVYLTAALLQEKAR